MGGIFSKKKGGTSARVTPRNRNMEAIADQYVAREFAEDQPSARRKSRADRDRDRVVAVQQARPNTAPGVSEARQGHAIRASSRNGGVTERTYSLARRGSPRKPVTADSNSQSGGNATGRQSQRSSSRAGVPRQSIKWQRGGLLGSGSFGRVYLGLNLSTGELMAVKQIPLSFGSNVNVEDLREEVESIIHEVKLMQDLIHPNIVAYIDTEREDDFLNIFLEFVPGGSISSLLSKFGSFNETLCSVYTLQILQGLAYLHDHSIVHRDIKGGNILVANDGTIKLADFGASKRLGTLAEQFKSLRGTPYWMAPEVIRQTGYARSADVWSVGCTVLEMLTGQHPWQDFGDQLSALYHIASAKSAPPIPEDLDLSPQCLDFLAKCFNLNPDLRPSVHELLSHPFLSASTATPHTEPLGYARRASHVRNASGSGSGPHSSRPVLQSHHAGGGGGGGGDRDRDREPEPLAVDRGRSATGMSGVAVGAVGAERSQSAEGQRRNDQEQEQDRARRRVDIEVAIDMDESRPGVGPMLATASTINPVEEPSVAFAPPSSWLEDDSNGDDADADADAEDKPFEDEMFDSMRNLNERTILQYITHKVKADSTVVMTSDIRESLAQLEQRPQNPRDEEPIRTLMSADEQRRAQNQAAARMREKDEKRRQWEAELAAELAFQQGPGAGGPPTSARGKAAVAESPDAVERREAW